MRPAEKRTAIAFGVVGVATTLAVLFWPRDSHADPTPGPGPAPGPTPPYGDPMPYEPSVTTCYRTGEPYNVAIMRTPEDTAALLKWLGVPIGVVELQQSDAMAKTPIWASSRGYTPKASQRLKIIQAFARSLALPGHGGAPASAIDGVWGECTARSVEEMAAMAEEGRLPPVMTAHARAVP